MLNNYWGIWKSEREKMAGVVREKKKNANPASDFGSFENTMGF